MLSIAKMLSGWNAFEISDIQDLQLSHHNPGDQDVTMFYKKECQGKKLLPRLEGAKKFFLTSSPCIDVRIRDFSDSPDSSCWRNDVHRFLMHQAVGL